MEACDKSFQEIKDKLTSALLLTLPKCGKNYNVYCDASRVGLVCVLMQGGKVIAYVLDNSRFMRIIIPLMP